MMGVALVVALALFGHRSLIETKLLHSGPWAIRIENDRFDGSVACSIRKRDIVVHDRLAVFSMGARQDTSAAEYRIDSGVAHSVHEQALHIAVLGAAPLRKTVGNPSGGYVVLPLGILTAARSIQIRATKQGEVKSFDVVGLNEALLTASDNGCQSSTSSIRESQEAY